ncbi:RagB/SusD family nutrient uptake outer membrane protein [Psychroserpens sp.]|uniref:RagB/SusD family nutrient uptake outer membrane protein n=1 Tax=Psychroserpens sp. TaxID=2020870 RepID=UPI001B0B3C08|nr:RagB/SusD family nutrient uptake outer membrane protein [Psychroserpens sp.]MBO6607385.1 RagB/SusD family nutrient uptake outer membrane protein [Psychroserpens sp.]MBO6654537.1 RagB/SusD family nutrient uptake outer membrane protein [Psychroserpens sp.]MBO6681114.1 RagB/SusD family nutrient uptake outer membrane protein [Psychroserpens sp.]MBO6749929.1 RagB/SusD family nutrient uptake outer membrane protein [Psychroserpens sp.]MBO6916083.1 RagB/SusD family nutrient uptake outer membrane pr
MKNLKITFVFILLIVMASCSDDFVDVSPNNENSEDFFNSEEDYQNALIAAYDLLQSTYLNVMLGEIASDNTLAGGENPNDVPGIQEIDDMIHTPINEQLRSIWSWMYAGVNRANYILEFQNKTDFEGKEGVLAQARFLRAYYYFELVKWFGDIPFAVDTRLQFGDQFEIPRTAKETVYEQIELDLIYAADNLPYVQQETGRVTKGAAQALLGKVYLYQDKFAESANVLEDLINNGPYDLLTDYSTMFENDNENNIESVFEVQYTDLEGAGFGCLQCSEGNVAVGFNGIRSYNGPVFESGFSFNVPTQEVVNAFEPGDMRLETAILDIEAWAEQTGATFSTGNEHTGYYNRKYIARQGDLNTGDANLTNPNNYRAIRFADVLLMAAEALNRGGLNDMQAQMYLNRVRERAFGNTNNNITATGTALTNAIYRERRVELVGEGHHFFDLVRTGRAAQEINGFQSGKHELFPIPLVEIQLAGNQWQQNPGY